MSDLPGFKDVLKSRKPLCLDGASATELEKRGLALDTPAWGSYALVDGQHIVRSLYRDYFQAGANIITTPTYQACEEAFKTILTPDELSASITESVVIAREEARIAQFPAERYVAASIGPYGSTMNPGREYSGDYEGATVKQIKQYHKPRLQALLAGKPDCLLFETIPNINELKAITELVSELAICQNLAIMISLSVKMHGEHEVRLADGSCMSEISQTLASNGIAMIDAIGANCFAPRIAPAVIKWLKVLDLPIVIYPNSGQSYDTVNQTWLETRDDIETWDIPQWISLGATVIGGCCQTSPETLTSVAKRICELSLRGAHSV